MSNRSDHPAARGHNNAIARIDQDGCASARSWIVDRMKDTDRPALDERYVSAYRAELKKSCSMSLSGARRRRKRKSEVERLLDERQRMRSEHARMTSDKEIRAMQKRLEAITERIYRARRKAGL